MTTIGLPGGASNPALAPVWADVAAIAEAAMDVLRMEPTDDDSDRVFEAAESAVLLVDAYLDRADDPLVAPPPPPVFTSCVQVTVELYRRKDAPFGVLNTWSENDVGPVRIGTDPLKGVEQMLAPYAHAYGVG